MTTYIESERQFTAWLERRFPDERHVDERIRRQRRRTLLIAVGGYFVVWMGASYLLPDRTRLITPPGVVAPWSVALWVLAGALFVVGLTLLFKDRPGYERSRVLDALDQAQRQELADEVAGRRPVVPGDEPVLERLARQRVAERHVVWLAAGGVMGLAPAEIVDPLGVAGVLRALVVVAIVVPTVLTLRKAREGARYLVGATAGT